MSVPEIVQKRDEGAEMEADRLELARKGTNAERKKRIAMQRKTVAWSAELIEPINEPEPAIQLCDVELTVCREDRQIYGESLAD